MNAPEFQPISPRLPRILLVGERSDSVIAHQRIPDAVLLAVRTLADLGLSPEMELEWTGTAAIKNFQSLSAKTPRGIWVIPNSPYESMDGALLAIRYARENGIPILGTCGGFQHALIEYARNVLGIPDADHAESNPASATPVISKLSCGLVNKSESLTLAPGSRLRQIYGVDQITEAYQCNYGVNPAIQDRLSGGPLKFSASSWDGAARAMELEGHPFFFGTLFQPERSAVSGAAHPLITEFLRAVVVSK